MNGKTATSAGQSDTLLWIGGTLVVGVGVTWLALAKPWSSPSAISIESPASATAVRPRPTLRSAPESSVDDPLRMAQLAFDAGMLIEPEEYSAWTLYERVLRENPGNEEAAAGLRRVAEELLSRGATALEQGRYPDAEAVTERILAALPDHEGAVSLAAAVEDATRAPEPVAEGRPREFAPAEAEPAAQPPARAAVREPEPERDPMVELYDAFEAAMAANRLLAPAGNNARDSVAALAELDADHELAHNARQRLFDELLVRARHAAETLDTQAADAWIDAADELRVDATAVESARRALVDRLVAMETNRPIPASELTIAQYVPPLYPPRALDRNIEGWVDMEFVVAADGSTRDISVTDASHQSHFRSEATRAVEQWRFEPRTFMGQTIEQRSYTRIRFTLDD